jgi:hypothetical protein
MRHERLSQGEWSEMVRCERHVPTQRVLRGAHREDARVVEQSNDREIERGDLRSRPPRAGEVRQIAHDRNRVLPSLLDGLLHLVEFSAVAADQDDRTVLRQLKCREAPYAGGRAGDDIPVAISRNGLRHVSLQLVVCLVSHW